MMKSILLLVTILSFLGYSQFVDHQHKNWDTLLKRQVIERKHSSTIDYASIKKQPLLLNKYIGELQTVTTEQFQGFSKQQQLAFLINAYNAFTVKLIIDHYPVRSIKDIGSFFTNSWKIKFFTLFGKEMNLDGIEHGMIRKLFNEPRIHFAVVCASIGCPALSNNAFTAEQLELQLEGSTRKFILDTSRNNFNVQEKKLNLSSIFKWYGDDFKKKHGSLIKFLVKYLPISSIAEKDISIDYLSYDWKLNSHITKNLTK